MLMRMSVHSELVSPVQCAAYEPEPRNVDLRAAAGGRAGGWGRGSGLGLGSGAWAAPGDWGQGGAGRGWTIGEARCTGRKSRRGAAWARGEPLGGRAGGGGAARLLHPAGFRPPGRGAGHARGADCAALRGAGRMLVPAWPAVSRGAAGGRGTAGQAR